MRWLSNFKLHGFEYFQTRNDSSYHNYGWPLDIFICLFIPVFYFFNICMFWGGGIEREKETQRGREVRERHTKKLRETQSKRKTDKRETARDRGGIGSNNIHRGSLSQHNLVHIEDKYGRERGENYKVKIQKSTTDRLNQWWCFVRTHKHHHFYLVLLSVFCEQCA